MDSTSGKIFLRDLIARAELLLEQMSTELNTSNLPLPVIMRMINSVHQIVATWEAILSDIGPSFGIGPAVRRRNGADGEEEDRKSLLAESLPDVPEMELKQDESRREGVGEVVEEEVEMPPPVFDGPTVPLDRYNLGQTGTGNITCVRSSGEFYMIDQTAKGLKLVEVFKTLQNLDVRLDVVPSSSTAVFGVRYDGTIMRAVRNKTEDEGQPCFILLLDTGEIVPLDATMELFEVPPFYARLAPFAIPCHLEGFEDNSVEAGGNQAYLRAILYETKRFQVVQIGRSHLSVRLSPPDESEQIAQKEVVTVAAPKPSYKISLDTLSPDQLEDLYEEPLNTTNVMKAVLGYVPQDDRKICPFYDPAIEGCFKGSACRLEHVAKLEDGWTRDKAPYKIQIRAEMEQPRVGTELILIPTFVANVNEFYAHVCQQKLSDALIDLQNKLNDPVNTRQFKLLNHEPHFRELVFATYKADGRWYRAEVLEFFSRDRISVFYVDYGNTNVLTLDQLRYWDDRFDYLPFQAVHCRVANIKPLKQNHPEATSEFRRAVLDHPLKAHVLDNQTPWEVLIYDEDGEDIGEILVMTKLAARRTPLVMAQEGIIPI